MDQCREFFPLHQHYGAALRQETVKLSLKVDAASSKAHGLQDAWLAPAWVMSVPFFCFKPSVIFFFGWILTQARTFSRKLWCMLGLCRPRSFSGSF